MGLQVKLISVRPISSQPSQNGITWEYQTSTDPWDNSLNAKWTSYPVEISTALEQAFQSGTHQANIDDIDRVDFRELVQISIDNPSRQRPIRRLHLELSAENDVRAKNKIVCRERFSFPLTMTSHASATVDTAYYGSQFVRDWLLAFTRGKLYVKFDAIFPALIHGLAFEGRNEAENVVNNIVHDLDIVREETSKQKECKRMRKLQDCCLKLYTKQCYLFRAVNTALRDDDRTKLDTFGPYCYLLYNCVGRHNNHDLSIRQHLQRIIHPNKSQMMIVYRGDHASLTEIDEYRQAAGLKDKYFKWLPFVSTSADRDVAETFGSNVLYIIELQPHLSNDQFTRLDKNSFIECEKEILLRPGVRFRVIMIKSDEISGRALIHIKIIPSYVSNLR